MQLSALLRRLQGSLLNSLIVMGGYVLSRVTGLLREMVITYQFGSQAELAAYFNAIKVTDLLYMVIIGGALGSSFIPVFIEVWERDGSKRAWHLASAVLTWALALLALASALLWLIAPQLTYWLYSGPDIEAHILELTAQLTRFFLLSPLLLGLGGLAMAALNAHNRFTLPALAPATYNLGIIGGAIFLAPRIGVWGLAWGVVAGAALYLVAQIPGLWYLGMRLQPTLGRGITELGTIARQMAPRVLGQSASQISILVTNALTARLLMGAERITGLNYAYQLMLLPYGIFSLSLSTVAFPRLARLFAEGEHQTLQADVRRTLSTILFLTLPATIALMILAVPLVRVLFQRGEFESMALAFTVMPLLGYATALPAFAASEILIRTFYAMQQTRIPVVVGLIQVAINLTLGTLALQSGGGVVMLTLAFSIANNIEAVLLFVMLHWQLPDIWRNKAFWYSTGSTSLASLGLAALLWGLVALSEASFPFIGLAGEYTWQQHLVPLLGWLLLVGLLGASTYIGLAALLGSQEARMVLRGIRMRQR